MINELLSSKCVEIVPKSRKNEVTLNPANLLIKRSGKSQLLVHFIGNPLYTKPAILLDDIKTSSHCLLALKKVCKTDLKSAYWQFPISEKSSDLLAFEFGGVIYRCLGLPYGAAQNVFIVQNINRLPMEFIRQKFDLYGALFIDDFVNESRPTPGIALEHYGINELVQKVKKYLSALKFFGLDFVVRAF